MSFRHRQRRPLLLNPRLQRLAMTDSDENASDLVDVRKTSAAVIVEHLNMFLFIHIKFVNPFMVFVINRAGDFITVFN